jgi:D-alanyl-D-alanine dipeptidase
VVEQLLAAERHLAALRPGWRLLIFDAWRPLEVQRFMVQQVIGEQCRLQGVDPLESSEALAAIVAEVGRFWAPPSDDLATPPPHSTGAAVDLTLAGPVEPGARGAAGELNPRNQFHQLNLGSPIDAIGAVSEPDHFAGAALADPSSDAARWHGRRELLRKVMATAGFVQHPNEWWHFSLGDQLWAWRSGAATARYGRWLGSSDG